MGGTDDNTNFILNCQGWRRYKADEKFLSNFKISDFPLGLAPMTGAVENIGWKDEESFYFEMLSSAKDAGFFLTIGDGCPDEKLIYGIKALSSLKAKASVFCKPYPQEKLLDRLFWGQDVMEAGGIDIDSFNIATMRDKVHLEKKGPGELKEIKKELNSKGLPFIIKGIFNKEDIDLCSQVLPDIAYVSNHGGRIPSRRGAVADFLFQNAQSLKSFSGQIWCDGGIRSKDDIISAAFSGASRVLIGRPCATALCSEGKEGLSSLYRRLKK